MEIFEELGSERDKANVMCLEASACILCILFLMSYYHQSPMTERVSPHMWAA